MPLVRSFNYELFTDSKFLAKGDRVRIHVHEVQ